MKMYFFRDDLTDVSADKEPLVNTSAAVKFFSKLNIIIFGYFDPINIFFDNKNKYFSG